MAEAKRPSKLKIGPHQYSVIYSPIVDDNLEYFGLTENQSNRITIKEGLPVSVEKVALIHEVSHVIWDIWGASDDIDEGKEVTEERICHMIGEGLMMVFVDNPDFAKYLQDN